MESTALRSEDPVRDSKQILNLRPLGADKHANAPGGCLFGKLWPRLESRIGDQRKSIGQQTKDD
jgi:hypothetical protein